MLLFILTTIFAASCSQPKNQHVFTLYSENTGKKEIIFTGTGIQMDSLSIKTLDEIIEKNGKDSVITQNMIVSVFSSNKDSLTEQRYIVIAYYLASRGVATLIKE